MNLTVSKEASRANQKPAISQLLKSKEGVPEGSKEDATTEGPSTTSLATEAPIDEAMT